MAFITVPNSLIPCVAVMVTLIASFILSADAIRCHQCNSHLEEDCIGLRLITPRAPLDEQYLKECETAEMFCRKVVTKIEVTGEKRIVRSCGSLDANAATRKSYCFDADNEGYKQTICTCFEDGCNAAPSLFAAGGKQWSLLGISVLGCALLATWLRRNV